MKKTFFLSIIFMCSMVAAMKSQTTPVVAETMPTQQKQETKKHHTKKTKKTAALPKGAMPLMRFDSLVYDFGNVKTGDDPTHIFTFKNTGNLPLNIEIVSGCDCTELDWTRTTVVPGGSGFVKAIFHTKRAEPEDHKLPLKKYIDIILKEKNPKNDYPIVESLMFKVFIVD